MAKRIRRAMKHNVFEDKLCSIVEVDDAAVKSHKGTLWEGGSYIFGMTPQSGDIKLTILNKLRGEVHVSFVDNACNLLNLVNSVAERTTRSQVLQRKN